MAKMGVVGKGCTNKRSPEKAIGAVRHCIEQFVGIAKIGFVSTKPENLKQQTTQEVMVVMMRWLLSEEFEKESMGLF